MSVQSEFFAMPMDGWAVKTCLKGLSDLETRPLEENL